MIHRPSLGGLIVGLLLTACLAGGVYATLRFNIGGIRYLPPQASTSISLESSPVSPFTVPHKTKDISVDNSRRARTRELARRPARPQGPRNIIAPEKAGSGTSPISPGLSAEVTNSPAPGRKILKPIGYVQKANGLVEAIVSEGDGIQVVHVGDVFDEKYTVAQISPGAVEIVASSPSPNVLPSASTVASNSTLVIRPGTEGSASFRKPFPSQAALPPRKGVAESKVRTGLAKKMRPPHADEPAVQASVHQADSRQVALAVPTPNLPKPIGYVEMQAGNRITVVPDGESVRLVQPELALAGQRGIEKGSKPVESASAPGLSGPQQAMINLNRSKAQPIPSADKATPSQASRTTPDKIVRTQQASPVIPSEKRGTDDSPLVASTPLGFVEKADGRVQAIVDNGEGVNLVQVSASLAKTLLAGGDSAKATEGALSPHAPPALPPVLLASAKINKGPPPNLSPGGEQSFPPGPGETADALGGKDSALSGPALPWEPPDRPPPKLQAPNADDIVVPDRSPPDDVMTAWMGLEAEVAGSSNRDVAVLGSLGYLNTQDLHASPHMAFSEPAAQPRDSPVSKATVLRSFGYGNWNYGRASPLAATLEGAAGANGFGLQNTIILKPIGYLDWRDGRALAVVDDGDDGVRLIQEGELLEDNRFKVVRVYPETVEIAELPITPPGLAGNSTFPPDAPQTVAEGVPLRGPLEKPTDSAAATRLGHREDQSSRLTGGSASAPNESSIAVAGFALRGQGVPCLDFKSILMVPAVSPGSWSYSGLNLYFPLGTRPALPQTASSPCAGVFARLP